MRRRSCSKSQFYGRLQILPSFITNSTSFITSIRCVGSLGTATMSASKPGARRPRSVVSRSSAARIVARQMAASGRVEPLADATAALSAADSSAALEERR